jgi:transposase
MGGKRPYLLAGQRSWLLARLDEKPDLTLHTLLGELGARGVTVSCDALWRFLRRDVWPAPSASDFFESAK